MFRIKKIWKWIGKEGNYNSVIILINILVLVIMFLGLLQVRNLNLNLKDFKAESLIIEKNENGIEIIPGTTSTIKFYQQR